MIGITLWKGKWEKKHEDQSSINKMLKDEIEKKKSILKKSNIERSYLITEQKLNENVTTSYKTI